MEAEKEVAAVMSQLQWGSGSSLYSALIMIRTTLIKSRSALSQLVQQGAVPFLIQLLEDRHRHVSQTKTTDIVMSILANLCIEDDCREKVVCCEGLAVIARVTLSSEQESIQNRGVRALANLALDVANCEKIFNLDVPAFVAKKLMETEDVECRSNYCRALQLFGQTDRDVKKLMEDTQAIQALAALLKLDNRKLALKSLRILSELSALRCCPSFTGQMLAANILEELVTLADDEDTSPASYSLSIILRLCEQEIMRPALGSAGAISLMVKLMKSDRSYVNKVWTLNALCLCTKEAVNRNKVQEAGGLELFLAALNESRTNNLSGGQFSMLYDRIISSLVNFLYNDDCLEKLLELGLVRILMFHLRRSCNFTLLSEDFRKETDSLALVLNSYETNCDGKDKLVQDGSSLKTGLFSNSGHLLEESLPIPTTSATTCSVAESCIVSVQHASEIEPVDAGNVLAPSDSSDSSSYDDQVQGVSKEKLEDAVDPLFIDNSAEKNDEIVVEHEMEKSASTDSRELPFNQPNKSRHRFSINSPTYQSETSWRLEDYTSGVTCKSFSQEQETHRMSPHYSSSYSVNTGIIQAPYSPLSAGASYYSPSQSSPSHSVLSSPLQSTIPSSPTSYHDSPAWLFSSPENRNSPGRLLSPLSMASLSPLPLSYQNQFSPLSNDFPASPLLSERHSQSPTPSSQTSLFSQDTFVPVERHMDSFANAAGALGHLDQLLETPREVATLGVPVAQDAATIENIYSASEDDEDDVCSDVDNELKPSPLISDEGKEVHAMKIDDCITMNNVNNSEQLTSKRCNTVVPETKSSLASLQDETRDTESSKRRRLDRKLAAVEFAGGIGHTENKVQNRFKGRRHSSGGFIADECPSGDEEIIQLSPHHIVSNASTAPSLKMDKPDMNLKGMTSSLKTDTAPTENNTQRPLSVVFGRSSENGALKSFHRTSSYHGKEKVLGKTSVYRRNHLVSVSPTARYDAFPLASILRVSNHQASPLVSDSPYRSPYPESSQNSVVSNEDLKLCAETTKDYTGNNSQEILENTSSFLPERSKLFTKAAKSAITSRGKFGSNAERTITPVVRVDQSSVDARVKKILRTTEINILILLARVSVKTKPVHLAETTVTSCLLGYIASVSNPIRRSCRILHRICSNPNCFEKLILNQVPAMVVKSLVLEKDGTFPHDFFGTDGNNKSFSDLLPSSQSSDCGSQTSEFGRRIDFEFGADAYSRMTTKKHSSVGNMFQNRPTLTMFGEAARDSGNIGDDIYEAGCSRVETRVKIGIELLHTMAAVAMSKFGEGEIKHLLLRRSAQDKLACVMSMLHLRVGWCRITRQEFFAKHRIYEKILPCLFIPDAPLVREVIVAVISLNVHIDNPRKMTQKVVKLHVCPDLERATRKSMPTCSSESSSEQSKRAVKLKTKLSLKKSEKTETFTVRCGNYDTGKMGFDHKTILKTDENSSINSQNDQNIDQVMDCSSNTVTCQHQNLSLNHDVCFSILGENDVVHKVSAHRKILMEKSEVFSAMFSGSYSESSQSEIQVPDVNQYAFEFIIHYLHGCSSGCSVIDSLSVEGLKDEIVAKQVSSAKSPELNITMQNNVQASPNNEKLGHDVDGCSYQLNEASKGLSENRGKSIPMLALSNVKTKSSETVSSMLEFAHSQDSLDSLTLEDRPESEKTSHASRKLNFKKTDSSDILGPSQMDLGSQELSEVAERCLDEIISRCENIIALADRFLLHGLVQYPASVLAHVCLCPRTIEDIFHVACFYKLDSLAFDCIRETLMSRLPYNEAAAIYLELAADGYREQVHTALTWLLSYLHSD